MPNPSGKAQAAYLAALLAAGCGGEHAKDPIAERQVEQALAKQIVMTAMSVAIFENKEAMPPHVQAHWDDNAEYVSGLKKEYEEQLGEFRAAYAAFPLDKQRRIQADIAVIIDEKKVETYKGRPVADSLIKALEEFTIEKAASQRLTLESKTQGR